MKEIKEELKEQFGANLMFDADNQPNRYMFNEKQLDVFIDEVVKKLGLHIVSQQRELLYVVCDELEKAIKQPIPPSLKSLVIKNVLADNCG
jgi:hypothetical protein